jgi:glutathione S-transferase
MMRPVRRLLTIPISHYCEKARWALERAGLAYSEERHVQGVHILVARRAGGRETVPVLIADEGVFNESEDILRYADRNLPEEVRLFPADTGLRTEVEELSRWLDEGLGPDGRRLMYVQMLAERKQMLQVNNQGVPRWEARMMSTLWPLATRLAARRLGLAPDTIEKDSANVIRSFDSIAERRSDGRRYLCGDRFTAADLTSPASPPRSSCRRSTGCGCRSRTSCPSTSPARCAPSASTRPAPTRSSCSAPSAG